jgi:putative endonuclease
MQYVYLLYSETTDHFYVGCTHDLNQRICAHNAGENISTKSGAPWRLVYFEAYEQSTDAFVREQKLKHHGKGIAELKKRLTLRR